MKILITGSDYNALMLSEFIKAQNNRSDIYITAGGEKDFGGEKKSYTSVNIKENDIEALRDFVKYNQIELTIAASPLSIINGIADAFIKEGFPIVSPTLDAARITFFNSTAKKVMYKLNINTPKFGIFDRENIAADYIRHAKFPIAAVNDFTLNERIRKKYFTYKSARAALNEIFENRNEKIVIENYIDEEPVYIYFLADGYNAAPLITLERREGKNFAALKAPSGRLSLRQIEEIKQRAVYPLLDDILTYDNENYTGILGLKIIPSVHGEYFGNKNNFYVLEYYNMFQGYDIQAFLPLLDEDFALLAEQAALRQFDEHRTAELNGLASYTLAVKKASAVNVSSKTVFDNDDEDYFISEDRENIIITKTSAAMSCAEKNVKEYAASICREDIFNEILAETKEELRV